MAKSFNSIKPLTLSDDEKKIGLNGGKKRFEDIDPSNYDFGVDSDYISSFLDDAGNFLNNAQKDYGKINFDNAKSMYDTKSSESAELKSRANTIRAYLNANKGSVNENYRAQLLDYLDNFESTSDSVFNSYRRSADNMKQFSSESDYEGAKLGSEYLSKYGDGTTYSDVSGDISRLESVKGGAARRGRDTAVYDRAISMLQNYQSNNRDLVESMSVDEVKAKKHETSDQTQQDREDYTWLADYNNGDIFAQNEEEGERNRQRAEQLTQYFKDKYGIDDVSLENVVSFGTQTSSSDIAYFDEDGEAVTWEKYLRIKSAETKLGDISNDEAVSEIYNKNVVDNDDINKIDKAIDMVNLSFGDATTENNVPAVSNDEQQAIVDYLTEKYNMDFSKDMNNVLADLNTVRAQVESRFKEDQDSLSEVGYNWDELNYYNQYMTDKEEYQKRKVENEQYAAEHPVAATAISIASAPAKVFDLARNIKDTANAAGADETSALGLSNIYDDYNVNTANQYTSTVSQNISDSVKASTDSDVLSWLASNSYSGISSSVQSAMTNAACVAMFGPQAGEVISLGLMGMEAAADGFNSAVRNGSNNQEALFTALASGVNEALFEKLSFDHLMKMKGQLDTSSLKNFIKSALKSSPEMLVQGLVEADEEVNTDIANTIADYIINGNHNEFYVSVEKYVNQGYSREEAEKLASRDKWEQLLESAYGGFVGGATSGGGKIAVNTGKAALNSFVSGVERNQYTKDVGGKVSDAGNTQELINQAKAVEGDSKAAQSIRSRAEKLEQRTEKSSNTKKTVKETGKLYTAKLTHALENVRTAEETEIKAAIKKVYAEKTKDKISSKAVALVADAIYKSEYTNEPLTAKEQKYISNEKAKSTIAEIKDNADVIQSNVLKAQRRATEDLASTTALTQNQEQKQSERKDTIDTGEFNISKDGETSNIEGTEIFDVGEIVSVGKQDIKVKLSTGKTESVKNISFGSEEQPILYQGIMDIQTRLGAPVTASFANAVVNEYNQAKASDANLSTTDFIYGVEEAVRKGYMNDNGGNYAVNLSESAREALFDEGRKIAQEHTKAQQKSVQSRIKGDNSQRKGTVTYEDGIERSQLNERQQVGVDVVTHIAEETGIDVVFFRSTKDGKGRFSSNFITKNSFSENGQAPNGFWHNGKMYIDVNAGMNGEGLILFTAAHEIVHMIREGSPESFKALADFLVENYAKKGVDVNKLVLKEMTRSTNLNYDAAYEEVIAQSCESLLRDIHQSPEMAKKLYQKDKGLATKIKIILNRILNAVKKWYGVAKPQSIEANYVSEMKDALSEIYDKYIAGIRAASENLRNIEKTADEGGAKYSIRRTQKMTWKEQIESYYNNNGNIRHSDTLVLENALPDFLNSIVSNNLPVALPLRVINKAQHGKNSSHLVSNGNIKKLNSAIRSPLAVIYDPSRSSLFFITGLKENTNKPVCVAVALNSMFDGEKVNCVTTIHSRENIEAYLSGLSGTHIVINNKNELLKLCREFDILERLQNNNKLIDLTVSQSADKVKRQSRSDADYLSAVERGDIKTAQRMVDEAAESAFKNSAIRKKDGTLRKVYHGTYSDLFTVFDERFIGTAREGDVGFFGKGFYFAYSKGEARMYGKNVMDAFVNIQNPFNFETELNSFNGERTFDYDASQAVFVINFAEKFPDLANEHTVDVAENGSDIIKSLSLKEFADTFKNLYNTKEFKVDKIEGYSGTEWTVYSDLVKREYTDYKGKKHSFDDYEYQARFFDEKSASNRINQVYSYMSKVLYDYIDLPRSVDIIQETDFTNAVKRKGYDGVIQSEEGDEVVAFDSSQIKSADPVNYDDNGDVIPLSERFNESNKDIRFSLRDNVEETRDLIAVHNLTEEKLLKSLRLGGLPMPSVAVIKAENGHKGYGDISIVFPKETIDPSENRNNKLYGGDVWSPTYPSIDYEVDTKKANKIYTRAREALRKPAAYSLNPVTFHPENIADRINSYGGEQGFIEHYKNDYGMKQFYLAEQDQAVPERYVEKRNEISDVDKEFYSFLADQLGKEAFSQEATKTGREWNNRYADDLDNARIDYMRSVYGELSKEEEENLRRDFESERPVHKFRIAMSVQGYLENGGVTVERKLDEDGIKADIDKLVDQSKYEEWLKELFNGIEKSSGIYNGTDYYTSSGNRRSFAQTHYTETLANVVRVMKSQDNGDSFFGGNGLWAIAAKNYGTIEEMKADKDRLTNLSDEERQEISNRFGERFTEIASSIANDGDNEFLALDNAYGNICDAVRNTNTKSGLLRELQKYHHKATVATVDDILDLVSDVGNMPVNYFEAKPQRAIKFNEVSTAVIPDNASQALRTALDKAGVKYVEYASGNEEARTEILNSLEDVKFQSRDDDLYFGETDDAFDINFGEDDSVENLIAREFVTHHEDMGEVLQNVADIELTPKKIESIVNRVIRDNLGRLDEESRHTLSIELQMALERVNVDDPQTVSDNIIGAVRKAIEGSTVVDDKAVSDYNQLRDAFKGKKFYLTDEQINQLKEHNMTLDSYRRAMFGKVTIVKRENAKRSISGGYADANELSLMGLHDVLESPDEILGFRSWEWDEKGYDAPNIIKEAFETLRDRREQPITNVYSDEAIDERAVAIAAKITGGIVEAKYNSKQNPYVTKLVADLKQKRTEAVNKQKEKNRQKLAELKQKERERAEKREQDIRQKYREQRARGYENRKRTEFRGKIKQLIGGFNTMLTHPVEGKYIPRGFVSQTIDILNAINTDSRRSERLSAAIADLKVKYEGLKADETGYASYNGAMDERLRVLSEMIEAEAEEWVPKRNKSIAYDNKRAATEGKPLKRSVASADFSIQNMSLELLQYTYETLNGMRTVIRESMRMTGEETRKMRQQITDALISEVKGVRREHTNMLTAYGNLHKSGYIMFKSFADYKKNSEWENRQNELNKGQLETSRFEIEFSKPTLELIADKKSLDKMLHTKVDVGLKDADGNPVLVTHDMLVHIYLDLSNEHNADHVAGDGYHVPDLDLYYKGKRSKSFEVANSRLASGPYIRAVELSQRMKELDIRLNTALTNEEDTLSIENEIDKTAAEIKKLKAESDKYLNGLKQAVESKMTAYDYQWVEAWREFNDMATPAINNVTMQTLGFKKAVVDNYFPVMVDKSFRAPDFDTIVSDMSLESWGSLKERVKGAKGAIELQGITDAMADRIHKTALYCGMTIPIQNFRKVYGGTQYNFTEKKEGDDFKTSVQRELDKKFGTPTVGDSANVYIKKLIADLIESRNNSDNGADKLLALARGGIAVSTLTTNPRVWLVQAASLVSALPELDIKSVLKGTATIAFKWNPHYKQKGAATRLRMSKVTPLYDLRRMGMVDTELGDIAKQRSSKASKAMAFTQKIANLTQKVDSLTTGRIWFMCEYWVKDHKPNLREGTIEFDKAVAEKYNQVIERTQPNYTPMQRGQILRSKNAVTKLFTMWQTQRMQNVNMLFDAFGTLNRTIYDYNHGLNGVNRNDLKTAWYQAGKTTLAFLVSNAMIVAIQAATDMLIYRKFKRYADDDEELTTESVLYGIFLNFISTLTGNFFGGSEIEDMISAVITGERYNEINPGLLGTLIEDVASVVKTAQALKSDGALSSDFLTNLNTAITNWCGIFGIAARNAEKLYDGVVGWIEKLVDKDLFQFSEIGSRVNKALNARAVNKIVKGDYSSVSVMTQDKYDEAYTKLWKKGKSEEDCQSAGRTAAKKAIASLVKETYLSTDDFEIKRMIRLYMYKSGYYVVSSGKKKGQVSLDVVDKTLESWKNNQDEKDQEAETAMQRKYGE